MGYMKDKMIEEQSRGWSSVDKRVCDKCLNDYALAKFVKDRATEKKCDYCGRASKERPIAVPVDDVMPEISDGIRSEWEHPDDVGMPYESAEGGYQGTVIDSYELINDELWDIFTNESLREDIAGAFEAQGAMWCDKYLWSLPPEEALRSGWKEFVKVVKHNVRYLFLRAPDDLSEYRGYEEIPPSLFLDRLGEVVQEAGLVTVLPRGTRIFRARVHAIDKTLQTASELGPPPIEKANYSNRMSPAGIPMFYGAFDRETAIRETYDGSNEREVIVTTAEFETARDFPVLDLTRLPDLPSIFDSPNRDKRPGILFLQDFAEDLSKRIMKDGREHIEYVPTQVVTEYFRHVFASSEFGSLKGLLYPSAQGSPGKCSVLFFKAEDCCDVAPGWTSAKKEFGPELPKFWLGLNPDSLTRWYSGNQERTLSARIKKQEK